jgi:predicted small metal-binding protein
MWVGEFFLQKDFPMKTMTCRQLGGACDHAFHADTFDEMAAQSQSHARAMYAAHDADHLTAMEAMSVVMANPSTMIAWMDDKKQLFDDLPHV